MTDLATLKVTVAKQHGYTNWLEATIKSPDRFSLNKLWQEVILEWEKIIWETACHAQVDEMKSIVQRNRTYSIASFKRPMVKPEKKVICFDCGVGNTDPGNFKSRFRFQRFTMMPTNCAVTI